MVLQGKLRQAVRWITQRHKGGILYPDDIDIKTGKPVIDVLQSKHPEARVPDAEDLQHYNETPEFVDVDITADTVESVARKLSGSAGPGGIDSVGLSHLLLQFGKTSYKLREAVADFTRWMANELPPWAAYRAMIASRCVALDKCPGVRPVGIGEIWRRLQAKCLLLAAGEEAKDACGIDQVCAGLEAGIEGSIHDINELWDEHEEEEE
jgi:hypothetical protein